MTPSQISEALAGQAESVVRMLLPSGRQIGTEWCVGDTQGGEGKSLKIQLQGSNRGLWKDFATGEDGGDLLDLWAAVNNLTLGQAVKDAKEYLGVKDPVFEGGRKREYQKPEKPQDLSAVTDKVAAFLKTRGITPEVVKRYKVGAAYSGRALVFPYFDAAGKEVVHMSYRAVDEKKFWASKGTRPALFGWQAIPANQRTVILTEGQLDAMAAAVYGYNALSIPFGAGKGHYDWIADEWDALERFDTIYLAFDMDGPGQEAVAEVTNRLGRHRVKLIELPKKDFNECLMSNVGHDLIAAAVRHAKTMDPVELRLATNYLEQVYNEFHPVDSKLVGFLPPWAKLAADFAFRYGETTVIAGVNGHGKSEGVGHISLSALAQDVRTCVASLEFRPRKWLARIARQALVSFTPDRERLETLNRWYGDKLWVFDVTGRTGIDKLLDCFLYAYRRYGVRLFVIDNMSKLGLAEDDYTGQKECIEKVCQFNVEHNTHTIVVAHMRKGDGTHDYEKGGKWGIKGSGAITDLVDNVIIWWRNKPKEDRLQQLAMPLGEDETEEARKLERAKQQEKVDAICEVEKQRNGTGEEPRQPLWFHRDSHQFLPTRESLPTRYL